MQSIQAFQKLVPTASVNVAASTAAINGRSVRIKRATTIANQVQVWRGEPIVLHVPAESEGGVEMWFVLPVSFQLQYARSHATTANQHASNAFDCMTIKVREIPAKYSVEPSGLIAACEAALDEASSKELRMVLSATNKLRAAVVDIMVDTMSEFFE